MKILVVGVGYVGEALLRAHQASKDELFATTTSPEKMSHLSSFVNRVFLLNPSDPHAFDEGIKATDGMILLVAPKKDKTYSETYLSTAKEIANSLRKQTVPYPLIYTSSTSVYEGANSPFVSEEAKLSPLSDNGKILLETENLLLKAAPTCVLRLGGIFGPGRDLVARARYFSGKVLPGLGVEPTNHIHLEDIVRGILFCLQHQMTGIYNLVNDDHRTRKDLYTSICRENALPLPIWNPKLPEERKGYVVSNHKIKNAGFTFSFPTLD